MSLCLPHGALCLWWGQWWVCAVAGAGGGGVGVGVGGVQVSGGSNHLCVPTSPLSPRDAVQSSLSVTTLHLKKALLCHLRRYRHMLKNALYR